MGAFGRRALIGGAACGLAPIPAMAAPGRWSEDQANVWYDRLPWLVGCNFIPSSAVNQLEMWQAATFDRTTIERELGWAASLGMNAARIFLHDIAWRDDPSGFVARLDWVLAAAARQHIRIMPVLFDSCWDPFPHAGPQAAPVPGVHNSRWVQSPGAAALGDGSRQIGLRAYVHAVVGAFRSDPRILAWDVWNEPDNRNPGSYGPVEPAAKIDLVLALLARAFAWVREVAPRQPLTSAVWDSRHFAEDVLTPTQRMQIAASDVVSFHCYEPPAAFSRYVAHFRRWRRPLLCTEYMARPLGSTIRSILPIARAARIGAFNWGLVAGRTQTYLPWDSWSRPYVDRPPGQWFHDLLHPGRGSPYRQDECQALRDLTSGGSTMQERGSGPGRRDAGAVR